MIELNSLIGLEQLKDLYFVAVSLQYHDFSVTEHTEGVYTVIGSSLTELILI